MTYISYYKWVENIMDEAKQNNTCDHCHGTCEETCRACHGKGETECSCCENTKECDDCDGTGRLLCTVCCEEIDISTTSYLKIRENDEKKIAEFNLLNQNPKKEGEI